MKKILYFFIFTISYFSSYALNFTIAPTSFEVDLDKVETHEVFVINNTVTPLRLEVYVDTAKDYEKKSLNSNIVIFPKKISIKPGAKQIVRFRVKVPKELEKGKYKSLLVFREIPSELKQKVEIKSTNEGVATNLSFITEIAIGVTGIKGGKE